MDEMNKKIKCKDCGDYFTITAEELKWYNDKGFTEPKRCKDCRALRRANVTGKETNYHGEKRKSF